jgi:hypothetical protein
MSSAAEILVMGVSLLKEALRARGLPTSGKKADLQLRLLQAAQVVPMSFRYYPGKVNEPSRKRERDGDGPVAGKKAERSDQGAGQRASGFDLACAWAGSADAADPPDANPTTLRPPSSKMEGEREAPLSSPLLSSLTPSKPVLQQPPLSSPLIFSQPPIVEA